MALDDMYPMATREEELYHESARELARMVVELEDENRALKTHIAYLERRQCSGSVGEGQPPFERCSLPEGHDGDCE